MSIQNIHNSGLTHDSKGRQYPELKILWILGLSYYPLQHFPVASISQGHCFFQGRIWKKINLHYDFEGHQYEVVMN